MSDQLKIYMNYRSQPSRAVMAFCLFNKIPFTAKEVDLFKGEHFKPAYKDITPLRIIPVIDDNGFLIPESHAILRYLCSKEGVAEHWYPKDPKKRVLVDTYLDWHHSNTRKATPYYQAVYKDLFPPGWIKWNVKDQEDHVKRAFKKIEEAFLKNRKYLASDDQVTIADISAACEIVQLRTTEFNFSEFPKLEEWLNRVMEYEEMKEVHKEFFNFMNQLKKPKL